MAASKKEEDESRRRRRRRRKKGGRRLLPSPAAEYDGEYDYYRGQGYSLGGGGGGGGVQPLGLIRRYPFSPLPFSSLYAPRRRKTYRMMMDGVDGGGGGGGDDGDDDEVGVDALGEGIEVAV